MLSTLRYSYVTDDEELPGLRKVIITASDGVYTDTLSIYVNVVIENNNPPELSFDGNRRARFIEGSARPLRIGII